VSCWWRVLESIGPDRIINAEDVRYAEDVG
jgi:hypothetical protein